VSKGEFRLGVRNLVQASSSDADALFDSWDDDRGGSLDLKELAQAMSGCITKAKKWQLEQTFKPELARANALRNQARLTEEAAKAAAEAERLEGEAEEFAASLEGRVDVRLGYLLAMRKVKPALVVTLWAKSRGEHAGELSKKEFREKVQELGLKDTGPNPTSGAEIDEIFDTFDEDGGGYMDADEAKEMVRGLQKAAEEAVQTRDRMARVARVARAESTKKVSHLTAAQMEMEGALERQAAEAHAEAMAQNEVAGVPAGTSQTQQNETKKKKRMPIVSKSDRAQGSNLLEGINSLKEGLTSIITNRSERAREAKERERRTAELFAQAAARLHHYGMGRAFNQWSSFADETRNMREQLTRAGRVLKNPKLQLALTTWMEYAVSRKDAVQLLMNSVHHMRLAREMAYFDEWAAIARMARHVRRATRLAIAGSTRSKLASTFGSWHNKMMEAEMERRLKQQGACAALGYWLRAKFSRCF
jgi:hypothetical protein